MKLIIDTPDEEYKTLSKMSEKEKVNELSFYERIIANGIPYEDRSQGEWIDDDYTVGYTCSVCGSYRTDARVSNFKFCPDCGAKMKGGAE